MLVLDVVRCPELPPAVKAISWVQRQVGRRGRALGALSAAIVSGELSM